MDEAPAWPFARGEMAQRVREHDWAATPLGTAAHWSAPLRAAVQACLDSGLACCVWWGPQLVQVFNDAWGRLLGAGTHPGALGRPARQAWPGHWHDIGPMVERVMTQGVAADAAAVPVVIDRHGSPGEVPLALVCSPLRDAVGAVVGVSLVGREATPSPTRLHAAEINAFLVAFSDAVHGLGDPQAIALEACRMVVRQLGAQRCHWSEIDWATREYVVGASHVAEGEWPVSGRFAMAAWEPYTTTFLAHRSLVVDDSQRDARLPAAVRQRMAALSVGATLAVPVLVGGTLRAALSVNHRTAHRWTREEIALVEGVAGRCWAEVERARAQAALRESRQRLALAFETLPLGIGLTDAAGHLVMVNDAMRRFLPTGVIPSRDPERLARWRGWDAAGQPIEPQDFPGARALRGEAVATGAQMLFRDDAGREVWTKVRSAPLRDGAGRITGALVVVSDIDHLKRSEEAARQSGERQAFLLRLSDALRERPDERSIKEHTVGMLARHLRLDRCWVSEVFEDQGLSTVGPEHVRADLAPMSGVFRLSDYPETMGQLATQPMVVHDAAGDARFAGDEQALLAGLQLRALLVAPLRKGPRRVVCALAAAMAAPRHWSHSERLLLEEVAERLWGAVERARVEAAAARAERRAEALIERMGDAHCVLDRDFRIERVNAATERLLGRPRTALVGRSHWDVFPASVDAPVGHAFRRVAAEGIEQHLTHHYTAEGLDLHIELDAYPTDEGGVALFWRDVTERVQAEQALRASEEKYRALFNEMDEAYAVVEVLQDERGAWADFRFLEVNPAFMRHTGMPHPVGRTATQLLGAPSPRWAELYGQAAQTGQALRIEEGEITLGRVFDLNIFRLGGEGSRRVAVLFTDITERRRAQDALRESEERLRLAMNVGELATWDWDLRSGRVVWSEAHYRMQGYAVGEVAPSYDAWAARVHPQDRAATEAAMHRAREQCQPYAHEFRVVHPGGEVHWLCAQGRYDRDETGAAVRMIGVMRDITEQRHAHELLQQRVAERTRALRELLLHMETLQDEERRRIARELHDGLGQYLASVGLAVSALAGAALAPEARAQLQRLQVLARQLDRELDRVVFLLRPTALEDCGLGEGVAAYVQTWSALTGVAADLEVHGLDGERLSAPVEGAVFRVVQEALTNVAKYARATRVGVSLERRRRWLSGSVEDDGAGFDAEGVQAPGAGGTHWGLLGMRERIEALGGSFTIESQPQQGTTVLWRVPLGSRSWGTPVPTSSAPGPCADLPQAGEEG